MKVKLLLWSHPQDKELQDDADSLKTDKEKLQQRIEWR